MATLVAPVVAVGILECEDETERKQYAVQYCAATKFPTRRNFVNTRLDAVMGPWKRASKCFKRMPLPLKKKADVGNKYRCIDQSFDTELNHQNFLNHR